MFRILKQDIGSLALTQLCRRLSRNENDTSDKLVVISSIPSLFACAFYILIITFLL